MRKASNIFDDLMVEHYVKEKETNRVSIGYTETNQEVNLGLKQMGHTLISGISRSGKTQLALYLLESLIQFAEVAVYSVKVGDFFMFRKDVMIVDDANEMSKLLRRTVGEIERRANRVRKQSEKAGEVVQCTEKPIVLMLDEYASFIFDADEATKLALSKIASIGAGMNVFLYIITQVPNKKIMGNVRDQIMTDIAFRQRDSYGSRMAVGTNEAMRLELRQAIVRNVDQRWLITHTGQKV